MSKKNKKKGSRHNPLADQLSKLDLELSDSPAEPVPPSSESRDAPVADETSSDAGDSPPPVIDDDDQAEQPQRPLSDDELFMRAVDDIDPARIYRAKFEGDPGATLPDKPDPEPLSSPTPLTDGSDEKQTREQVQDLRDAALFEKMVGSVRPLEDRHKYKPPRRSRPPADADDDAVDPPPPLITPCLPRQGDGLHYVPPLNVAQREMLKRHQRFAISRRVPDLNLRGDDRQGALDRLQPFMVQHWQSDAQFVRIIHGRGLRSELEPVLKPTVLQWLEGPGRRYVRGYIPERITSGDYGSLIVELSDSKSE